MKIIAVILVYNCGDVLLNTLKSIDGKVDEIHCYDTCWLISPKTLHSSDNTKTVIENFSITSKTKADYTELPSPMSEGHARTASIKNINDGDWVFVIDSDEVVTVWGDDIRSILETSNEKGYFWFMEFSLFKLCRLFKKTKDMGYFFCTVMSGGKSLGELRAININIHHDYNKRKHEKRASGTAQRPHP